MAVFGLLYLQVFLPRQFARVCHSVNKEWGVKENHVAVIALHNCGKCYSQIFKTLKRLKISHMFDYRAIKYYEELWRVEDGAVMTSEKLEGSSSYQNSATAFNKIISGTIS
jgi:hypothetical protein